MAKSSILIKSKLKKVRQLIDAGHDGEAETILLQLIKKVPRDSDVWLYYGLIHGKKNDHVKAAECFKKASQISPKDANILYNYGIALRDSGQCKKSIEVFKRSLNIAHGVQTINCLGHAYMQMNDYDNAIKYFSSSLSIDGNQPEIHSNLGSVYQALGQLSQAEKCYRIALKINPDLSIFDNLGSVLISKGLFEESIDVYRKGLVKNIQNTRIYSNLLLSLNYLEGANQDDILNEHRKWSEVYELEQGNYQYSPKDKNRTRLRIGYISPDFREHSVAYFIEPIIYGHNRERFDVYGYYSSQKYDEVTARIKGSFDVWREVANMSEQGIADIINSDNIDILVDLTGHTSHNCLLTFSRKPAPVQITYLGYPNTTGSKYIKYRITDTIADPLEQNKYYTETLCRIPECFLTYRPDDASPDVASSPCVENGYITFGSFNNLAKMNDKVIDIWSIILKSVPDSKLILKNPSLTDEETRSRYIDKFVSRGVENERIKLIGHTETRYEHLLLYGSIDIALDTFPYNGTTTTCEALWMGLPVITLQGMHHASRVSASILLAIDKPEWIADTTDKYISIAENLSKNTTKLADGRINQRQSISQSSLCDSVSFVKNLESLYEMMWDNYLSE